jgi:hypothetical protein
VDHERHGYFAKSTQLHPVPALMTCIIIIQSAFAPIENPNAVTTAMAQTPTERILNIDFAPNRDCRRTNVQSIKSVPKLMEKLSSIFRPPRSKTVSKFFVRNFDLFELGLCHQAYRGHSSGRLSGDVQVRERERERYESEPIR